MDEPRMPRRRTPKPKYQFESRGAHWGLCLDDFQHRQGAMEQLSPWWFTCAMAFFQGSMECSFESLVLDGMSLENSSFLVWDHGRQLRATTLFWCFVCHLVSGEVAIFPGNAVQRCLLFDRLYDLMLLCPLEWSTKILRKERNCERECVSGSQSKGCENEQVTSMEEEYLESESPRYSLFDDVAPVWIWGLGDADTTGNKSDRGLDAGEKTGEGTFGWPCKVFLCYWRFSKCITISTADQTVSWLGKEDPYLHMVPHFRTAGGTCPYEAQFWYRHGTWITRSNREPNDAWTTLDSPILGHYSPHANRRSSDKEAIHSSTDQKRGRLGSHHGEDFWPYHFKDWDSPFTDRWSWDGQYEGALWKDFALQQMWFGLWLLHCTGGNCGMGELFHCSRGAVFPCTSSTTRDWTTLLITKHLWLDITRWVSQQFYVIEAFDWEGRWTQTWKECWVRRLWWTKWWGWRIYSFLFCNWKDCTIPREKMGEVTSGWNLQTVLIMSSRSSVRSCKDIYSRPGTKWDNWFVRLLFWLVRLISEENFNVYSQDLNILWTSWRMGSRPDMWGPRESAWTERQRLIWTWFYIRLWKHGEMSCSGTRWMLFLSAHSHLIGAKTRNLRIWFWTFIPIGMEYLCWQKSQWCYKAQRLESMKRPDCIRTQDGHLGMQLGWNTFAPKWYANWVCYERVFSRCKMWLRCILEVTSCSMSSELKSWVMEISCPSCKGQFHVAMRRKGW